MTDNDIAYLCAGFGVSLLLYWLREAAYIFYFLFQEK